jgi:hypothetical protein
MWFGHRVPPDKLPGFDRLPCQTGSDPNGSGVGLVQWRQYRLSAPGCQNHTDRVPGFPSLLTLIGRRGNMGGIWQMEHSPGNGGVWFSFRSNSRQGLRPLLRFIDAVSSFHR